MNTLEPEVMPSEAVAVRQQAPTLPPPALFGTSEPTAIVQKATIVANALKEVIRKQNLISTISGKEYPRCEAWTLLGTMLGIFPVLEWTRKLDNGWEARVEARTRDGAIVGAAEAECLRTESNWAKRDDFAIRSMAQTRATAKCLRMPLGFVMTLAGFEATPAEEMVYDAPHSPAHGPQKRPEASKAATIPPKQQNAYKATPAPFPTVQQRDRMIEQLNARPGQPDRDIVTEYFVKAGAILDTEQLEDLPLRFVPATAGQMRAIGSAIAAFGNGEQAGLAFPPHTEPVVAAPAPVATTSAKKPIEVTRDEEPWRTFPIPFGKDAGTPLGKLEKNKLFGWWANFEVKTEYNGKPIAPDKIAKDRRFREMLDEAGEHYEFKDPDEEPDEENDYRD